MRKRKVNGSASLNIHERERANRAECIARPILNAWYSPAGYYTVRRKKRATSFSIRTPAFLGRLYSFCAKETGMNTLQFTYLMA